MLIKDTPPNALGLELRSGGSVALRLPGTPPRHRSGATFERWDEPARSDPQPKSTALAAPNPDAPIIWTATGLERQVFLDHTGRRGRRVRRAGHGLALLSAAWLAALLAGSVGFTSLPSLQPSVAALASRGPAPVALAPRTSHGRAPTIQSATLSSPNAQTAHQLARRETRTVAGTIR